MENNPTATPASTPPTTPSPENGVWVSKEEYERLRVASATPVTPLAFGSGQEIIAESIEEYEVAQRKKNFWTYAGGAAAILVFMGLTANFGSWFMAPLGIGLVVFVVLAIISLIAPMKKLHGATLNSLQPVTKQSRSALSIVTVIILLVLLIPLAPVILLILFLIIAASTGQASGS